MIFHLFSSIQESETQTSEMEEEKMDQEKKVKDEGRTEKAKVPNTPPIVRFPCCPMRK